VSLPVLSPSEELGHSSETPALSTPPFPLLPEYKPVEKAPSASKTVMKPAKSVRTGKARPRTTSDRAAKLERAKQLLAQGRSRRAAAKEVGIAESTLRAWLKAETEHEPAVSA
jgi:hypothetical protein